MREIQKVAVIGAGVMGAGIAAHIANAGVEVVLLDIVPKDAADRSVIAKGAVQKLLKTDPAPLMHPRNAKRIQPGNIEDDIALLGDCDWIVEAVIENLEIKQDLYLKIDAARNARLDRQFEHVDHSPVGVGRGNARPVSKAIF